MKTVELVAADDIFKDVSAYDKTLWKKLLSLTSLKTMKKNHSSLLLMD